jgi:hypothetical protein
MAVPDNGVIKAARRESSRSRRHIRFAIQRPAPDGYRGKSVIV